MDGLGKMALQIICEAEAVEDKGVAIRPAEARLDSKQGAASPVSNR